MSFDVPDDRDRPVLPAFGDYKPPECGPDGQAPSWDSVSPYWLAFWTLDEVQQITDEKLTRAIRHFYPPPGKQHRQPTNEDHHTFRLLIDEQAKRKRVKNSERVPWGT